MTGWRDSLGLRVFQRVGTYQSRAGLLPGAHREGAGLTSRASSTGVDDGESECGLDNFGDFDWVIENHGDSQRLEEQLENLIGFVRSRLVVRS